MSTASTARKWPWTWLGGGALLVAVATMLIVVGRREAQFAAMLDYVADSRQVLYQVEKHTGDEAKHLDAREADIVTTTPVRLDQIEKQLDEIKETQREILRELRKRP